MLICFLSLSFSLSLKPIFLVSGFGNSPIYSEILNPFLYPECPSNITKIIIKSDKVFNKEFLSRYSDCAAKLLRVQYNKTTGNVDQLPGISTYSTPISDPSTLNDTYGTIIANITQLGYQSNLDFFSVGYNYFLHPFASYTVYKELKNKIEEVFSQTGEKSIIISYDQGTSFTSIFLSNYSQSEWVRKYIDSVIFISPTFAGLSSISHLISQKLPPFISNEEFKKTIMNMPGLHIMLPNYAVYENFSINSKFNASQTVDFLKELGKIDSESEYIFKSEVEKFLKVPIPEPPVPSIILHSAKAPTNQKIISIYNNTHGSESSRYACNSWRHTKCVEVEDEKIFNSNKASQFIIEYIIGRTQQNPTKRSIKAETILYENATGNLADDGYVNSHMIDPLDFTYAAPEGHPQYPEKNIFDGNTRTMFMAKEENSYGQYYATITITFSEVVTLESILFEPAYLIDASGGFTYIGFPITVKIYVSTGDQAFKLNTTFGVNPTLNKWVRFAMIFPELVTCDKLKIEFVEITAQTIDTSYGRQNLMLSNIYILRHLDFTPLTVTQATGVNNSPSYVSAQKVAVISSTSNDQGMANYPISNAFDDDPSSYFIQSDPQKKEIELSFNNNEVVTLEAFIFDLAFVDSSDKMYRTFHGFPTKVNVYSSLGSQQYELKYTYYASTVYWWSRIQFVFPDPIECDKLKIELEGVTIQTIEGNSKRLVTGGLHFIRKANFLSYTTASDVFAHDGYVMSHFVRPSNFEASALNSDANYSISNAFDGDKTTYYTSGLDNNATFMNAIYVNFNEMVKLEAILYDVSDNLNGVPTKFIISSSVGNEGSKMKAAFVGSPSTPNSRLLFQFSEPFECDKLAIEFVELYGDGVKKPVVYDLFIIQSVEFQARQYEAANETYLNDTFVKSVMVESSEFTYSSNSEGVAGHEISNAFDGDSSTFYLSAKSNTADFFNAITIQFTETVFIDSILYDGQKNGGNFEGFPTGVIIYSSLNDQPFEVIGIFYGAASTTSRIHFPFDEYFKCDRLMIEFVYVTSQSFEGTSNSVVVADIFILEHQFEASTLPIDDVCMVGSPCVIEGGIGKIVTVTINETGFSGIQNSDNGGAIRLKNAGIICARITFASCISKSGGGGAIYIENVIDQPNTIQLTDVSLSNCKADFGGAIFIYSISEEDNIEIYRCHFSSNQAAITKSSSSSSSSSSLSLLADPDSLVGGSAIFITAKRSTIFDCSFIKNVGENQLKIFNKFDEPRSTASAGGDKSRKAINVVKYCRFEIERQSKSSLFYAGGKNGAFCFLRNSVFVGNLQAGCYHINGESFDKFAPKLVIDSCKFSTDYSKSFDVERSESYLKIVFQKQEFNYIENDKAEQKYIFEITIFILVIVAVIVIIFVFEKQSEAANLETLL